MFGTGKPFFLAIAFLICFCAASAQIPTVGVLSIDTAVSSGYSLLAGADSSPIYLIDNCGREINSWKNSPYTQGIAAYLDTDGTMVRTCRIPSTTFTLGGLGGRIERWSWDDSLVWALDYSTATYTQHHDIELLPNGNMLILATERKAGLEPISAGRDPALIANNEVWSEYVVEIEPIGTDSAVVVWEWHIWDHLVQEVDSNQQNYGVVAGHPELLDVNYVPGVVKADWLHANAVDYNEELDQIMISIAELSEIWIIDHSTTTSEAASHSGGNSGKGGDLLYRWGNPQVYQRGAPNDQTLIFQHHAHWIPAGRPDSGKVMIFNNGGSRGYSSVEIIDPPVSAPGIYTLASGQAFAPVIAGYIYTADTATNFFSKIMSGAEQMPNGNLLICEGAKGYNFEVTPAGDVVWEYENPITRSGIVNQYDFPIGGTNGMFRLEKYQADFPGFQGLILAPGPTVEPGSNTADCEGILASRTMEFRVTGLTLYPNPAQDQLHLKTAYPLPLSFQIIDPLGRKRQAGKINGGQSIDISDLESGIYWLFLDNQSALKFIKIEP